MEPRVTMNSIPASTPKGWDYRSCLSFILTAFNFDKIQFTNFSFIDNAKLTSGNEDFCCCCCFLLKFSYYIFRLMIHLRLIFLFVLFFSF